MGTLSNIVSNVADENIQSDILGPFASSLLDLFHVPFLTSLDDALVSAEPVAIDDDERMILGHHGWYEHVPVNTMRTGVRARHVRNLWTQTENFLGSLNEYDTPTTFEVVEDVDGDYLSFAGGGASRTINPGSVSKNPGRLIGWSFEAKRVSGTTGGLLVGMYHGGGASLSINTASEFERFAIYPIEREDSGIDTWNGTSNLTFLMNANGDSEIGFRNPIVWDMTPEIMAQVQRAILDGEEVYDSDTANWTTDNATVTALHSGVVPTDKAFQMEVTSGGAYASVRIPISGTNLAAGDILLVAFNSSLSSTGAFQPRTTVSSTPLSPLTDDGMGYALIKWDGSENLQLQISAASTTGDTLDVTGLTVAKVTLPQPPEYVSHGVGYGDELVVANTTDQWTAYNTNLVEQDGDAIKVTCDGSNTNGAHFKLDDDLGGLSISDVTPWATYEISFEAKVSEGDSVGLRTSQPNQDITIENSEYEEFTMVKTFNSINALLYVINMGAGDEFWIKNLSVKRATNGYATYNTTSPWKVQKGVELGGVAWEGDGNLVSSRPITASDWNSVGAGADLTLTDNADGSVRFEYNGGDTSADFDIGAEWPRFVTNAGAGVTVKGRGREVSGGINGHIGLANEDPAASEVITAGGDWVYFELTSAYAGSGTLRIVLSGISSGRSYDLEIIEISTPAMPGHHDPVDLHVTESKTLGTGSKAIPNYKPSFAPRATSTAYSAGDRVLPDAGGLFADRVAFKAARGDTSTAMSFNTPERGRVEGDNLYTAANAAGDDTAATTGITAENSGTLSSVADPATGGGSNAIEIESNTTPTSGAGCSIDLSSYMSAGNEYEIRVRAKHVGSGGNWEIALGNGNNDTNYVFSSRVDVSETSYTTFKRRIVYDGSSNDVLWFREDNGDNDGGLRFDLIEIIPITPAFNGYRPGDVVNNLMVDLEDWRVTGSGSITKESDHWLLVDEDTGNGQCQISQGIGSLTEGSTYTFLAHCGLPDTDQAVMQMRFTGNAPNESDDLDSTITFPDLELIYSDREMDGMWVFEDPDDAAKFYIVIQGTVRPGGTSFSPVFRIASNTGQTGELKVYGMSFVEGFQPAPPYFGGGEFTVESFSQVFTLEALSNSADYENELVWQHIPYQNLGVQVAPARTNSVPYSWDFSNAAWNRAGSCVVYPDQIGIDGIPGHGHTIVEGGAGNLINDSVTIPDDSNPFTTTYRIPKIAAERNEWMLLYVGMTRGTTVAVSVYFNPYTGVANWRNTGTAKRVTEHPFFWEVEIVATNNGTGNTSATIQAYSYYSSNGSSDHGAGTGYNPLAHVQVELNQSYGSTPTMTNGATITTVTEADLIEYSGLSQIFSESAGTILFDLVPNAGEADWEASNDAIVRVGSYSMINIDTFQDFNIKDGTNRAKSTSVEVAGVTARVAASWSDADSELRISVGGNAAVTATYDGAFSTSPDALKLLFAIATEHVAGNVVVLKEALSTADLVTASGDDS